MMRFLLLAVLGLAALSGCVDTPKKTTQVVDDRPRLAFDLSAAGSLAADLELVIDGVSYGRANQFLAEQNALRVIPGRHVIELKRAGETLFVQEVVLGETTTRIIKVPKL